jgi:hypothetical protein
VRTAFRRTIAALFQDLRSGSGTHGHLCLIGLDLSQHWSFQASFPEYRFDDLSLTQATPVSDTDLRMTWTVNVGFYFSDYDWSLIFREIGVDQERLWIVGNRAL